MSTALTKPLGPVRIERATLEDMLEDLSKYGKPRLMHMGEGWHAAIEMYVGSVGVDFKVASGFSLPTPTAAAAECAERLNKALAALGK